VKVTLTEWEIRMAVTVGAERQIQCVLKGIHRAEELGGDEQDNWQNHIEGALGELAFCKAKQRYWGGTVNTFKGAADVGRNVEVRTTPGETNHLWVRASDKDDYYYVLVRGICPIYDVVGYMQGKDAKREDWRCTLEGWGKTYWVPNDKVILFRS
jgi:hypothetical protein